MVYIIQHSYAPEHKVLDNWWNISNGIVYVMEHSYALEHEVLKTLMKTREFHAEGEPNNEGIMVGDDKDVFEHPKINKHLPNLPWLQGGKGNLCYIQQKCNILKQFIDRAHFLTSP